MTAKTTIGAALVACSALLHSQAHAEAIDIPVSLTEARHGGGYMTIDITINNTGPFAFVLDTAAEDTFIAESLANRLGLEPGEPMLVGSAISKENQNTLTNVTLGLQGLDFQPQPAIVSPDRGVPMGLDGIIGTELLQNYVMTYDSAAGNIRLDDGAHPVPGKVLPLARVGKRLFAVDVMVNGIEATGLIDTGAGFSIMNPVLAKAIGLAVEGEDKNIQASGVNNRQVAIRAAQGLTFEIANEEMPNRVIGFGALPVFERLGFADKPVIIVGADILNNKSWSIDFRNGKMIWGLKGQES